MKKRYTQKVREENLKGVNNWREEDEGQDECQKAKTSGYIGGILNAVSSAIYGSKESPS